MGGLQTAADGRDRGRRRSPGRTRHGSSAGERAVRAIAIATSFSTDAGVPATISISTGSAWSGTVRHGRQASPSKDARGKPGQARYIALIAPSRDLEPHHPGSRLLVPPPGRGQLLYQPQATAALVEFSNP